MNKKEFTNGDIGETIGFILGGLWFVLCSPLILIKWTFTKESLENITIKIFNTKIGKFIKKFDY